MDELVRPEDANTTWEDVVFPRYVEWEQEMVCNETCCLLPSGRVICFDDYNFLDEYNITTLKSWETGVRWTYAILITLLGVFGNLAIMIILYKNRILLRSSVNCFILNLSVSDLLLSIAGPIPFTIQDTNYFYVLGEAWCYLQGYIQILVMFVSVTSLTTISLDRMLGVVRPFHTDLEQWKSLIIIILIWIGSALLAVPFAIYRDYQERQWQDLTQATCGENGRKIYVWWVVCVIGLTWLPFLIMIVCYATILIYFNRQKFIIDSSRREHPAITHLKRRVMKMMFLVVVCFVVCWVPFQVLQLGTGSMFDSEGHYVNTSAKKTYTALFTFAHFMIYTNSALNPIIYALMHQTFRRAFRVTFSCLFNHKSLFVLTPGEGRQQYVWSVRSNTNVYGDTLSLPRREFTDRIHGTSQVTPSALLSTSALVASIALDHTAPSTRVVEDTEKSDDRNGRSSQPGHTIPDEKYVKDLKPEKLLFVSTGALGHLITQVIEEETSSDVERERTL